MKLPIKLPAKLTRAVGKAMMKVKAVSPEICFVTGIVAGAGALVLVGVETWKGKEKLSEDIEVVKTLKNVETTDPDGETDILHEEHKKEVRKAYFVVVKDVTKMYWKPALLATGGAALIIIGGRKLRKDLTAMTIAYNVLKDRYDKVCKRMTEELGEEKAQEILYGAKTVEEINAETGEVTKKAVVDKNTILSPYAFQFDSGDFDSEKGMYIWRNLVWSESKLMNMNCVKEKQDAANWLLRAKGYYTLNEVRDAFGLPPVAEGFMMGWVYDPYDDNNLIDFGVLDGPTQLTANRIFMDERNKFNTPIINPNCYPINHVFKNIYEYDTKSNIAFSRRRKEAARLGIG